MRQDIPFGSIEEAVRILREGGVVVVPTDTCFGLAGDALREETVARVLAIKGRASTRTPAVFVPDLEAASRLGTLEGRARALAEELLPGPWTILVSPRPQTPRWLVSPEGLVGIRWIQCATVSRILESSGLVLTATSANTTGHPPPYTARELADALPLELVDLVVTGECGGLAPSTVIDLTRDPPLVVREGSGVRRIGTEPGEKHDDRHRV